MIVAGLALAPVAGLGRQVSAANSRSGPIARFASVEESACACTTSRAWVAMPALGRSFTVAPGAASSVVVTFSADALVEGERDAAGLVRLRIGTATLPPGEIALLVKGSAGVVGVATRGTYSFTWSSAPLAPGSHTARIAWATGQDQRFCVVVRSLTILHR